MMIIKNNITATILAGGASTRMGGNDKGLIKIAGKALYQYTIDALKPQVKDIQISANRHIDEYERSGYPVLQDSNKDYLGPLAGIREGLIHAATTWVVFAPCDVPSLPGNLVEKLWLEKKERQGAYVVDGSRAHPVICLLHKDVLNELNNFLIQGDRKLMLFMEKINAIAVNFALPDHFHNLNTKKECLEWENKYLAS